MVDSFIVELDLHAGQRQGRQFGIHLHVSSELVVEHAHHSKVLRHLVCLLRLLRWHASLLLLLHG